MAATYHRQKQPRESTSILRNAYEAGKRPIVTKARKNVGEKYSGFCFPEKIFRALVS
jgi:hypothetical protein